VTIGDAPNELPRIELERCYFHSGKFADSGQVAIGLHSPAQVSAKNCAFKAAWRDLFTCAAKGESTITRLPVLRVCADRARFPPRRPSFVPLSHRLLDLFAPRQHRQRGLTRPIDYQADAACPRSRQFHGSWNRYHNLNSLWTVPAENGAYQQTTTREDFSARSPPSMAKTPFRVASRIGQHLASRRQPYKAPAKNAFLLRPLREVRKTRTARRLLGVESMRVGRDQQVYTARGRPQCRQVQPPRGRDTLSIRRPTAGPPVFTSRSAKPLSRPPRTNAVIYIKEGKVKNRERELNVDMTVLKNKSNLDVTLKTLQRRTPDSHPGERDRARGVFFSGCSTAK